MHETIYKKYLIDNDDDDDDDNNDDNNDDDDDDERMIVMICDICICRTSQWWRLTTNGEGGPMRR